MCRARVRLRGWLSKGSRSAPTSNASSTRSTLSARPWLRSSAATSTAAAQARDADRLQQLLDDRVLLVVHINPETRVKVARGPAPAVLQQAGYTPVIVKIINESRGTPRLRIGSPQAGPVYAGMSRLSGERMQQQQLRENENVEGRDGPLPRRGDVHGAADDGELERPRGRVRRCADLLERSRATRGDDHVRRRPGDAGPRLSRGSAGVVHREAGGRP